MVSPVSPSLREQIEALRPPANKGWYRNAWNAALDAVLEVVAPVCPECGGSKEIEAGYYDEAFHMLVKPCPSCQGDREALPTVTIEMTDAESGAFIAAATGADDREARRGRIHEVLDGTTRELLHLVECLRQGMPSGQVAFDLELLVNRLNRTMAERVLDAADRSSE